MSDSIFNKLLSYGLREEGTLKVLRESLSKISFPSDEEKNRTLNLVAHAHTACFNMDGREIVHAIEYFFQAENKKMISEILRISRLYGQIRAAHIIQQVMPSSDFKEWFANFGIKWFDIYSDEGFLFVKEEDIYLIDEIINQNFVSGDFWKQFLGSLDIDQTLSPERKELIYKLANKIKPVVKRVTKTSYNVDRRFREYCFARGIKILKVLQTGINSIRRCSYVYLVLDTDGIIKVYKEVLDYNGDRLGNIFDSEDWIYEHIKHTEFLARYYDHVNICEDLVFIRMSYLFGQPLSDYTMKGNLLDIETACFVIKRLATHLAWLHERGIVYLDLKPENILFDGSEVNILDFGISRRLAPNQNNLDIYLADPRYGTPECGKTLKANFASDVFQLGVIFHQLITGEHPFELGIQIRDRESEILNYFWPNITAPYSYNLGTQDSRLEIINKMLEKDPSNRPSMKDIAESLIFNVKLPVKQKGRVKRQKEGNTILFPARMGIPHKGHIEYMARILEVGYHLVISLQRSYTLTDRDPIPKWLVMKMIAQSLLAKGFSSDDFEFIFTPFFNTQQEHRKHFAFMPHLENVAGVASSNPDVHKLFEGSMILNQKSLFGVESVGYNDLSHGEKLRRAVKDGDYITFREYAAEGIESVISFSKLQEIYGKPEIEFVFGDTKVVLLDKEGKVAVQGKVFNYLSPEESLIVHMNRLGHSARIINPYSNLTEVLIDNKITFIGYQGVETDGDDEIIYFKVN